MDPVVEVPIGATSRIIQIFIEDSASAGNGKSGLAFNTGSLIAYYKRNSANASVAITLVTATLGTWTSGGFTEIDATNMRGWYELHVPDAALATGADEVSIQLSGASGMFDKPIKIRLGGSLTVTERAAMFTQTLTEAYAANGSNPTVAQILFMIFGVAANYYTVSTTLTVTKLDRSTVAMTFTLDSSSSPTSRLRAT